MRLGQHHAGRPALAWRDVPPGERVCGCLTVRAFAIYGRGGGAGGGLSPASQAKPIDLEYPGHEAHHFDDDTLAGSR